MMKIFEKALSDNNIPYSSVEENIYLKRMAIRLRTAYIKSIFLSRSFILLCFIIAIKTLINIDGLINFNHSVFDIAFNIFELVFYIFCLVFTVVLVMSKTKKMYCQRHYYYINCNRKNIISILLKDKGKYSYSEVYELTVKNKKTEYTLFL